MIEQRKSGPYRIVAKEHETKSIPVKLVVTEPAPQRIPFEHAHDGSLQEKIDNVRRQSLDACKAAIRKLSEDEREQLILWITHGMPKDS